MIYAYLKLLLFTVPPGKDQLSIKTFGNSLYQTWNIGIKTLILYKTIQAESDLKFGAGIDGYSFQQIDGTNSDFQTGLGFGLMVFGSTIGNSGMV